MSTIKTARIQPLPKETKDKMAILFQEAADAVQVTEDKRAQIVQHLAEELAKLPGVIKERIASTIKRRFHNLGVPISASFIYMSLGPEYKNPRLIDAARESMEERISEGWDQGSKEYVSVEGFLSNLDEAVIKSYGRNAANSLLLDLGNEVKELREENTALKHENVKLREENTELKKQIEGSAK